MCDPVTLSALVSTGLSLAQGAINSDTAKKQAETLMSGNTAAKDELMKSLKLSTGALIEGMSGVKDAYGNLIAGGNKAQSQIFDLANQLNQPIDVNDPTFQRDLQAGRQAGSARGMSLGPSYNAELSNVLLTGAGARRNANIATQGALLSPIFSAGANASGAVGQAAYGTAGNLANLYGGYGANMANLNLAGANIGSDAIKATAMDLSPLQAFFNKSDIFTPKPD